MSYMCAHVSTGPQAALVDDVSGTLPPYDQFIVLGPERTETVAAAIRDRTGLETAVVSPQVACGQYYCYVLLFLLFGIMSACVRG